MTAPVPLSFENRVYKVTPGIALVAEIEAEMGPVPLLQEKFPGDGWSVTDLVALVQMMLNAQGRTVDYRDLGDRMIEGGLEAYRRTAQKFFAAVMRGA